VVSELPTFCLLEFTARGLSFHLRDHGSSDKSAG
jgi:hypothetical protein